VVRARDRDSDTRLFGWNPRAKQWADLGPYEFVGSSNSGKIIMLKRSGEQHYYLVWPKAVKW
jgi:hypothetical protein